MTPEKRQHGWQVWRVLSRQPLVKRRLTPEERQELTTFWQLSQIPDGATVRFDTCSTPKYKVPKVQNKRTFGHSSTVY